MDKRPIFGKPRDRGLKDNMPGVTPCGWRRGTHGSVSGYGVVPRVRPPLAVLSEVTAILAVALSVAE